MDIRRILIALAVALVITPTFAAATQWTADNSPGQNEQVVEGHTVYAVFEKSERAWAVAGLVREFEQRVLWFNDQYLVGDVARYPCGGYAYAVPRGDRSPYGSGVSYSYGHSYRVTDPNDQVWEIDYYTYTYPPQGLSAQVNAIITPPPVFGLWVVPILNLGVSDNGKDSCQPIVDVPPAGYLDPGLNGKCYSGGQYFDDGTQRCGPVTPACPGILDPYPDPATPPGTTPPVYTTPNGLTPVCDWPRMYNFLLVGLWDLLGTEDGIKQYGCSDVDGDGVKNCEDEELAPGVDNPDFGDDNEDKNGCEEGPYRDAHEVQYDCIDEDGNPSGDGHSTADPADDNEGNSHAYNPTLCDNNGDGVIDGADTDGDGFADDTPCWGALHEHETARVDLYYNGNRRPPLPLARVFLIDDTIGSTAPFHNHDADSGTPTCPPGWINPGGGGYPAAPTPYCP